MDRSTENIPKINTSKMNEIFKELVGSFKMVDRITPLWICGREKNFGFRPSLEKDYLPAILKNWIEKVENGYVLIIPIVFYICDAKDRELITTDTSEFLVLNHYNVLVSYMDANKQIIIERYEPSNSLLQKDLNDRMKKLFMSSLKKYTNKNIIFKLVAPKGLQAIYKDKTLCGHHILYWTMYRLKYGLENSITMITEEITSKRFERFCQCMKESTHKTCIYDVIE